MESKKCLRCEETIELKKDVEFCKYCGAPVINSCSNFNCGAVLDDDAAFCSYCGSKSTFNNSGIVNSKYISNYDLPF